MVGLLPQVWCIRVYPSHKANLNLVFVFCLPTLVRNTRAGPEEFNTYRCTSLDLAFGYRDGALTPASFLFSFFLSSFCTSLTSILALSHRSLCPRERPVGGAYYQFCNKNSSQPRDSFCTGTVISFFLNWFSKRHA